MLYALTRILLDLLNKKSFTAKEMAAKLEISERSVYRYIDALSAAHVPVVNKKGRGGGIALCEEYRLSSMYFTKEELQLITTALRALTPATDEARRAEEKLSTMRPISRVGRDGYVNEDFVVDNANAPFDSRVSLKLDALIEAKKHRRTVSVCYHNRSGRVSERVIEPRAFVYSMGAWYVYAYCRLDAAMRLFKISRITHVVTLDEVFEAVPYEKEWNLDNPNLKQSVNLILKVSEPARYDVEEWLGIENVTPSKDGGYIAESEVFDNEETVSKIMSFGGNVAVLSPKCYADEIVARCLKTLKLYK